MAIEQFDELETRHTFLTTQRKGSAGLDRADRRRRSARIDETTRERFAEAFARDQPQLPGDRSARCFGGGRAGLTLLDENDPLESGIDIIAQPPGKRLQSVQLLSGGEKALTAIALMFAHLQLPAESLLPARRDRRAARRRQHRPIRRDAAGMQTHTQFILITHNRKTMEIADRLYGVTMEEPGVSKLISVRLN